MGEGKKEGEGTCWARRELGTGRVGRRQGRFDKELRYGREVGGTGGKTWEKECGCRGDCNLERERGQIRRGAQRRMYKQNGACSLEGKTAFGHKTGTRMRSPRNDNGDWLGEKRRGRDMVEEKGQSLVGKASRRVCAHKGTPLSRARNSAGQDAHVNFVRSVCCLKMWALKLVIKLQS